MFQKIMTRNFLIFCFSLEKNKLKPQTQPLPMEGAATWFWSYRIVLLLSSHESWSRPLSVPMKYCLSLSSLYVISTLMHSPALSIRVHLFFKYSVYSRLCNCVWQRKTAWHPWLSSNQLRRWHEEFVEGPGGRGLWKGDKEAGQGCIQWLPPGEHVSPSNLEQNLIIFVSMDE